MAFPLISIYCKQTPFHYCFVVAKRSTAAGLWAFRPLIIDFPSYFPATKFSHSASPIRLVVPTLLGLHLSRVSLPYSPSRTIKLASGEFAGKLWHFLNILLEVKHAEANG